MSHRPFDLPRGLQFVRVLGQGATGTVVLARQTALARVVAVKIISVNAPRGTLERIRREAKVLAGLDHRHILPVYQLHQTASILALVTKYAPWGDLAHALPHLSGSQRVAVLSDIASALEAAHSRGIVHRDLKPANILSDEYGRALLADFGLARLPRGTEGFRTVGLIVTGTPLYLAPEQISSPQVESPSIDHYAFGILAFQMLTGRWPYPDPTWRTVQTLHLHAEPVHPRSVTPGLDPVVADVLLGLLAKDARRRRTAVELARSLSRVAGSDWDALIPGVPTRPTPPDESLVETRVRVDRDQDTVETAFGWSEQTDTQVSEAPPSTQLDYTVPEAYNRTAMEWVTPEVYRPPRGLASLRRVLVFLVAGMLLGVAAYMMWVMR